MLKIKKFLNIHVALGNPIRMGNTKRGYFKIIPIKGGDFDGDISGKVLSYGGDCNYKYDDIYSYADASYVLQVDHTHENIYIENKGILKKEEKNLCHPTFIVDDNSKYSDLTNRTFVSKIVPNQKAKFESIIIEIYEVCVS